MSDRATLRVPVLPVRDIVLFPGIIVPLLLGRGRLRGFRRGRRLLRQHLGGGFAIDGVVVFHPDR